MYKLYDVVEYKTDIKGFWIDKGKLYVDNIIPYEYKDAYTFNTHKQILFETKKQLAVFYAKENKAYIEDRQGNTTTLSNCIRYKEKHISKAYIKALLFQHSGLTIYRKQGYYIIEIWKV